MGTLYRILLFSLMIFDVIRAWPATDKGGNASRKINCENKTVGPARIFTPTPTYGVCLFCVIAIPVIIVFGLVGNILSALILSRTAMHISGHFYIFCLTIFDSLALVSIAFTIWIVMVLRPYFNYIKYYDNWIERYIVRYGFCQVRVYITFTIRTVAIWTVVVFTVERLLAVCYPMRAAAFSNMKVAKSVISLLIGLSIAINILHLFAFDPQMIPCSDRVACRANDIFFAMRYFNFIVQSLVPAILICGANTIIVYKLRRRSSYDVGHAPDVRVRDHEAELMITKRLLVVSTTFVLLTFPSLVNAFVQNIMENAEDERRNHGVYADVFMLSLVLFTLNFGVNFVIYCLTGPVFRRAAAYFIMCQAERLKIACHQLDPRNTMSVPTTKSSQPKSGTKEKKVLLLTQNTAATNVTENERQDVAAIDDKSPSLSDNIEINTPQGNSSTA